MAQPRSRLARRCGLSVQAREAGVVNWTERAGIGSRSAAILLAVGAALAATPAEAGDATRAPWFELRPLVKFEAEVEENFDLDRTARDREVGLEPKLRLVLDVARGRRISGFVEADVLGQFEWEQDEPLERDWALRINQAYVRFADVVDDVDLRVGRWLFRDRREWLIDENIDGIHLSFDRERWTVDALAGRVNLVQRDVLDPLTRGDPEDDVALMADYAVTGALQVGGYVVYRRELTDARDRPLFLGLRAYGEVTPGLVYWADLGHVRGRADDRRLRGFGFDVGGTYVAVDHSLRPRVTLGYAWGSGDDGDDGIDRSFRQTGLQSNEDRLGGFAKLKYYGEVLDPELSNLHVMTAGLGLTLSDRLSIDLLYHHYRLVRSDEGLRDDALSGSPTGGSRHLGDGLDLVLGFRPELPFEIDAAVGWFEPGAAYRGGGERADGALFARIELEIAF